MSSRAKLGAVVAHEKGFSVRQSGTNKSEKINGQERKIFQHDGTYAIHASRKKIIKSGFKQTTEAITYIQEKL